MVLLALQQQKKKEEEEAKKAKKAKKHEKEQARAQARAPEEQRPGWERAWAAMAPDTLRVTVLEARNLRPMDRGWKGTAVMGMCECVSMLVCECGSMCEGGQG